MMGISEYDRKILEQIIDICVDTYNCYKDMVMLETKGFKNSKSYREKIRLIKYNRGIESSLFKFLDIKNEKYLGVCCDYLYYKCNEDMVCDCVCHRILYQLEENFDLIEPIENFSFNEDDDMVKLINYVMLIMGIFINNDLNYIYVNEFRNLVSYNGDKDMVNMDIYNIIYENVGLENEFLNNNFEFSLDGYLYSGLRTRLLCYVNELFLKIGNIDKLYFKVIGGICYNFLVNKIQEYYMEKSDLFRLSLISGLIAIFVMKDMVSVNDFKISFDENTDYKAIVDEAFRQYKVRRVKYKKLF